MIGGTGPESTVEYYQRLIAKFRARTRGTGAPSMIINSIDNRRMIDFFNAQELERIADLLVEEVERLARAGADLTPPSSRAWRKKHCRKPGRGALDCFAPLAMTAGPEPKTVFFDAAGLRA